MICTVKEVDRNEFVKVKTTLRRSTNDYDSFDYSRH